MLEQCVCEQREPKRTTELDRAIFPFNLNLKKFKSFQTLAYF